MERRRLGARALHPDVEWELAGEGTLDQVGGSRGRDALLAYWRRFWAAWQPGARWEIEEFRPTRGDQVLACGRLHVLGRTSGLRTGVPVFHLWTVRDEVVVRLLISEDRASALEAADR